MKTKKSLGQHFLNSAKIIQEIVDVSDIKNTDTILEIGPGEGILTSALILTGANILSIEKDDRLIPLLEEKFSKEISSGKLKIIHKDILELEIDKIIGPYKVVANIPYYITGQIIRMFLDSNNQPESMTLLVQKEVAERIVAKEGKESLLSLSVKIFGTPKYIKTVGKNHFKPQPNVDSAILLISNISKNNFPKDSPWGKWVGMSKKLFFEIIHAGFAHKRKQLLPNLSSLYNKEKLIEIFEKCNINQKVRAEDVHLETWIEICKIM